MMARLLSLALTFLSVSLASSQAAGSGYVGYNLQLEGDKDSVIYSTDNTRPNAGAQFPKPDVYLNASVSVGEIDIEVDNLTAKINLEAQVLSLLTFNAGVDLSIDQVKLSIEKVQAKVLLEARLENLVRMINTTLSSIDLNPVLATLGEDLGNVLNTTAGAVGGLTGSLSTRSLSFELEQNILYSTNNYRASKHTNRILAQNGDIVDHYLNNGGDDLGQRVVGSYSADMTPVGEARTTERNGIEVTEREYVYQPFPGLSATCSIYFSADGKVVGTQIVAESSAGGSSTISDDENDL